MYHSSCGPLDELVFSTSPPPCEDVICMRYAPLISNLIPRQLLCMRFVPTPPSASAVEFGHFWQNKCVPLGASYAQSSSQEELTHPHTSTRPRVYRIMRLQPPSREELPKPSLSLRLRGGAPRSLKSCSTLGWNVNGGIEKVRQVLMQARRLAFDVVTLQEVHTIR